MRHAARAIIIRNNALLVIHRNKFGKEYYTLPGGGIEAGESPSDAVIRELQEEAGFTISSPRLVFVESPSAKYGIQHVFLCKDPGGKAMLQEDSIEAKLHTQGNLHTPEWVDFDVLDKYPFRSEKLKAAILQGIRHGFPEEPIQL